MRIFLPCLLLAPLLSGQALYSWLESIAQQQLAARQRQVAALRTPEEIRARGRQVRENLLRWIGGLPAERTPLNLRRTGTLTRAGYRVEKIVYESQPRFYVTASLYIPDGPGPFPAVLQPTGHSVTAKARELYQSLSIGLAKYGFVVLTYDPLGQGERRLFFDPDLNDSKVGGTTVEHQVAGVQALLGGESIARPMIWDGIRGLDLLASLPQVDKDRIGVAGCSGGGTLTAYIAAIDDRVKAAAPACYITSWKDQLKGTGPRDAEQQFPGQLKDGFDHGDFLIAMAPKPYLIASTTEDFFPLAGAERTFQEAQRLYNRFGAEDKVAWFTAPGGHGMRADTRGAIYAWMRKWLQGKPGPAPEPDFTVELEEDLNVTPTGQVSTSFGGDTVTTLNIRRFAAIHSRAPDLAAAIRERTKNEPGTNPLQVETEAESEEAGLRIERLSYEAEPGRRVGAILYRPQRSRGTILVADAAGKQAPAARALAAAGHTVLAIETALTAEPDPAGKTTWLALMTGKTITGIRMADIARGLDLLASRGLLPPGGASAFGRGNPGTALLHAAALDNRIARLALEDLPPSFRAIASMPIPRQVFDVVLPGVLASYGLPDLAAAIAPRAVVIGSTVPANLDAYRAPNVTLLRRRELSPIPRTYFPE